MTFENRDRNPYYQEWRERFEEARGAFYRLNILDVMKDVAATLPKTKLEVHDDADQVGQGFSPHVKLLGEEDIWVTNHGRSDEVMTSSRNELRISVSHIDRLAEVSVWEVHETTTSQNHVNRVWISKEHSSRNSLLPDIYIGLTKLMEIDSQASALLSQVLNP